MRLGCPLGLGVGYLVALCSVVGWDPADGDGAPSLDHQSLELDDCPSHCLVGSGPARQRPLYRCCGAGEDDVVHPRGASRLSQKIPIARHGSPRRMPPCVFLARNAVLSNLLGVIGWAERPPSCLLLSTQSSLGKRNAKGTRAQGNAVACSGGFDQESNSPQEHESEGASLSWSPTVRTGRRPKPQAPALP